MCVYIVVYDMTAGGLRLLAFRQDVMQCYMCFASTRLFVTLPVSMVHVSMTACLNIRVNLAVSCQSEHTLEQAAEPCPSQHTLRQVLPYLCKN